MSNIGNFLHPIEGSRPFWTC